MDRIAQACTALASCCLAGMVAVLGATLALRPIGILVPSSEEITTFLMVGMALFGFVSAYVASVHVRVDTLHRKLPAGLQHAVDIVVHAGGALLCATLAWQSGSIALTAWTFHDVSDGLLAIPMWIPLATLPTGLGLLAAFLLRDTGRLLAGAPVRLAVSERDEAAAIALQGAGELRG